ncbi:MAG: copper chaperone PCu(A)C [Gammaproteobacteria bacterium]|nr:copper chaperone PCu(A)C [Gammaproteobacteria bacterium]
MSFFFKSLKPLFIVTGLLSLSLSALFSAHANEHENKHQNDKQHAHNEHADVMVMNGYARATFALAKTGAVYFTLHNQSDSDKTLVSVSVAKEVADEAQIHTTVMEGDMMKMRELTEGVKIKPGEMVAFKSGGNHIMLLGLTKGLAEGSNIPITLSFDNGSELKLVLPVKKDEAKGHHHHH